MGMNWEKLVETYPNEWIALTNYKEGGAIEITGTVIVHHPSKRVFHKKLRGLLPQYRDVAVRYTGQLIRNPDIPLLWQITHSD